MLFSAAKNRAKRAGRAFTITIDWFKEKLQAGHCEVTGLPFDYSRAGKVGRRNPFAPSLDRIRNEDGYTPDNTQVVLTAINIARNELSEDQFFDIMSAYVQRKTV